MDICTLCQTLPGLEPECRVEGLQSVNIIAVMKRLVNNQYVYLTIKGQQKQVVDTNIDKVSAICWSLQMNVSPIFSPSLVLASTDS